MESECGPWLMGKEKTGQITDVNHNHAHNARQTPH